MINDLVYMDRGYFCPQCMAEVGLSTPECPECRCPMPGTGWPVDEHLGRLINGTYRVEEKLGTGGFGVVLRARHLKEGHDLGDVVLKFLHPQMTGSQSLRQRFMNEAKAARKLISPHIIKIFDFDFDERGHPFIVMEYLEGKLLHTLIKRGPMDPARVVRIALQIASALQACHAADIVHRDLTPRNIILLAGQREDFVKVLDFGIARLPDATFSLSALGTPRYMPPEQIMQKDLDQRADIFAFGVILFQCLTGEPPILAEQPAEYLHLNLAQRPRRLRELVPSLPERLELLLDTMMAKDREQRPSSMAAIEEQVLEIAVEEGWLPYGYRRAGVDEKETTLWRRKPPREAGEAGKSVASRAKTALETRTETATESGDAHSGGAGTLVPVVRESSPPPRRQLLIWGTAATVIAVLGVALFLIVISLPDSQLSPAPPSGLVETTATRQDGAPSQAVPERALSEDSGVGVDVDARDADLLADALPADRDLKPVRRLKARRPRFRRPTLRRPASSKKAKGAGDRGDEGSFKKVPGGL